MEHKHEEGAKESSEKCCKPAGKCCCWMKVVGAIVLILIGWVCGFMLGSGKGFCGKKSASMCQMGGGAMPMACPMSTPEAPKK